MRFVPTVLFLVITAAGAFAGTAMHSLPDDAREAATQAHQSFAHGRYPEAEKLYELILEQYPDNLDALSNLGVIRFRIGKIALAKESLQRAIAIAPNDGFSHRTLGIIDYIQGSHDDAMSEIAKALAIDPKDQEARGYMILIKNGREAAKPHPPLGDFDTLHERLLRQTPDLPAASATEIGLPASAKAPF